VWSPSSHLLCPGRRRRLRRRASVPPPAMARSGARWLVTLGGLLGLLGAGDAGFYLNQWAVEIDGGPGVADAVADDYGFTNLGQVRLRSS